MPSYYFVLLLFSLVLSCVSALQCYQCVSTYPGCGTLFNWLWNWSQPCNEDKDVCVKIIEQSKGEMLITRNCLSSFQGIRKDIPADSYEGCRPAVVDPHRSNYVFNSQKELDIYDRHENETTWCLCSLDNWCNTAAFSTPSTLMILAAIFFIVLQF